MENEKSNIDLVFRINSNTVAFLSVALTLITLIWNIFFGYSKIITRLDIMQRDIDDLKKGFIRLETRMDRLDMEFHKMDIGVNTLEQRKP